MGTHDTQSGGPIAAAPDLGDIDTLVAAGQIAAAADLLARRLADEPALSAQPMPWLQLGGLRRMLRQPFRALEAVERALALAPRDFMALVMRATIIERIAPEKAGPAWHRALLQRPDTALPKPLADAVAAGEAAHAAWLAARAATLDHVTQTASATASADEGWRMQRFCDNALGKTRPYHSEPVAFFYPGLTEREYHPRGSFPWLAELEAATDAIRA